MRARFCRAGSSIDWPGSSDLSLKTRKRSPRTDRRRPGLDRLASRLRLTPRTAGRFPATGPAAARSTNQGEMTSASLGRGPSGREHPRLIGLVMRRAHVEVKQNDRRNAGISGRSLRIEPVFGAAAVTQTFDVAMARNRRVPRRAERDGRLAGDRAKRWQTRYFVCAS